MNLTFNEGKSSSRIEKRNSILIAVYNRVEELQRCLRAIKLCKNSEKYNLVIFYHEEIASTKQTLIAIDHPNLFLIPVNGGGRSPLQNMNSNRIEGLNYCFEYLGSDFVVAVEDDVQLAYDALVFSESIVERYASCKNFRALNLGSRMSADSRLDFAYGLFRYGLSGQGSCMTRATWKRIKALNLLKNAAFMGFDSLIEDFFKTGFVVSPYASRYMDEGWRGTHSSPDPNNQYYLDLQNSFMGTAPYALEEPFYAQSEYHWRKDCIPYQPFANFYYWAKYFARKFGLLIR